MKSRLNEAELNLPPEYIKKVKGLAKTQHGSPKGPTSADMQKMGSLIHRIFQIQSGHFEELTELGKKIIQQFYGPVIEGVELDVKIVDPDDEEKLEMAEKMLDQQEQESEEEEPEIELNTMDISADVDKRKLINNIMQGEAQNVHSMIYAAKAQIEKITGSKELPDLYIEFLNLNRKFDWDESQNLEQMVTERPEFANAMETDWEEGEDGDTPKIKARVLDLPMLIHETVKGIYELIASGAIDPDPVRAEKVLKATDTLTDEQQDIRYGPYIAADLRDFINRVAETVTGAPEVPNMREYVFGKMIQLPSKDFVQLVTAILLEDARAERPVKEMIQEVVEELKHHDYEQSLAGEEEEDDNELIRYMQQGAKPTSTPTPEKPVPPVEQKKPNWREMGKNELNYHLNLAIDNEDWTTAKEIQQEIERKGGMKESAQLKKPLDMNIVKERLQEAVEPKDVKRVEDLFLRSKGDDDKLLQLTQAMARSITDPQKAMRRAEAAWQLLGKDDNPIADIFLARAEELGMNTGAEAQTSVAVPAQNSQPDYDKLEATGAKGVIYLPTASAIALWEWEITGQLSDGAWENTQPHNHWEFWSDLVPEFGQPEVISRGFPRKTGYSLTSLIEYVGDRMVKYGRMGKAMGHDVLSVGDSVRSIVEDLPTKGPINLAEWKAEMIKKSDWRAKEYYWKGLTQAHIDAYYRTVYTDKDMRKDLQIIKTAMRTAHGMFDATDY